MDGAVNKQSCQPQKSRFDPIFWAAKAPISNWPALSIAFRTVGVSRRSVPERDSLGGQAADSSLCMAAGPLKFRRRRDWEARSPEMYLHFKYRSPSPSANTPARRIIGKHCSTPPTVVRDVDPHLPVMWRQLVRLSDRTPAPRSGAGGQPRGVDALELPPDA